MYIAFLCVERTVVPCLLGSLQASIRSTTESDVPTAGTVFRFSYGMRC
jgi:hypothetical protein